MKLSKIKEKNRNLKRAKQYLKTQFIGLDDIIDDLVNRISGWYVYPHLQSRPLIINLWGMTGVGKTDLVRKLIHYLELSDTYLEIELGGSDRYYDSITRRMMDRNIESGKNSVLLFDEIQRFRSINTKGEEKPTPLNDFWELLSDGKISKKESLGHEDILFELLASIEDAKQENTSEKKRAFRSPYQAKKLREGLGGVLSMNEIAQKSDQELASLIQDTVKSKQVFEEYDYTKCLIFICGNLDDVYVDALKVDVVDIDADIFHAHTKQITVPDIKRGLNNLFTPEKVARFGNNHIIYPALKQIHYEELIERTIHSFNKKVFDECGISIKISQRFNTFLYQNGVFPVQGVRPLLSTMSMVYESHILQHLYFFISRKTSKLLVDYDDNTQQIVLDGGEIKKNITYIGDIKKARDVNAKNISTIVSVHEAGHALMYVLLFGISPLQVKSQIANFKGGFTFSHRMILNQRLAKHKIQVLLAGQIAEKVLFGDEKATLGNKSDLQEATSIAAHLIRSYGFSSSGFRGLVVPITHNNAGDANTDIDQSNEEIEDVLQQLQSNTRALLIQYKTVLIEIASRLHDNGLVTPHELQSICAKYGVEIRVENENYTIVDTYALPPHN